MKNALEVGVLEASQNMFKKSWKFAPAEMFTLKIFCKIKLIIKHLYSKKIYADSYVQYPFR